MNYFTIKNLHCAYNWKEINPKIVLHIEKLVIPKNEIVFLVGESGCGKSTILETLGLMNDTMVKKVANSEIYFQENEHNKVDYLTIWTKGNQLISDIRLHYFSFIFQQTNLMRNFSIFENIAITKMIQNANSNECVKATQNALDAIGLGKIDINGKVFELSGGQQQRLAFARAIVADFSVIFCDEPTGNLDPETANTVMKELCSVVRKKNNATAVIVSHDLNLALSYADRIIKIEKHSIKDNIHGIIDEKSVFESSKSKHNTWKHLNKEISKEDVLSKLKEK